MEKISGMPTQALTDREILLLTYQQLQNVSDRFEQNKTATDIVLKDLQDRMGHIEQYITTDTAVKRAQEARSKRQLTVIAIIITLVNSILSFGIQVLLKK